MKVAGALVFAGGLVEEIELAVGMDESGNSSGPITKSGEFIGRSVIT